MSKNKVEIDVKVDDKGTTKKVGLEAKKTAGEMDKVSKSAGTLDRNMKGAGQASSGSTKNFSKMSQGMGGLVGTYATLAATVFAVSAAFQFLKSAADFKNLVEGQKALGAVTGIAYESMTRSISAATDGQLKYADAAKAAAIGTAAGLSPTQLTELGRAAKVTSIALGRDLGDSFDRLIRGVTKAEPELLDELGIILRLEAATAKYGLQIGKAGGDLNEFERSQAVANEVLEQANRKFGMMEKLMDPTASALNRFSVAFDDVVNKIKEAIAGPLATMFEFLSKSIYALLGLLGIFAASILKQILPSMNAWQSSSKAAGDAAKATLEATRAQIKATAAEYERLSALQNKTIAGSRAELASTFGGDPGVNKSKTGKGALDFLSGNTDNKTAEANAKKAIAHYDMQTAALGKSLAERTGLLKDYSVKEVANAKVNMGIIAGEKVKDVAGWRLWSVKVKQTLVMTGLEFKKFTAGIVSGFAFVGRAAAGFGAFMGKAFFWLSIASIAFDLLKMAKEYFYPPTEASKKLSEETTRLTEKYTLLNKELQRTVATMNDYSGANYTLAEQSVARANAIQSLDIPAFIKESQQLKLLDKESDAYAELYTRLRETAKSAWQLNYEFNGLYNDLTQYGEITKKTAQDTTNLSNSMKQGRMAIEQMPATLQAVSAEYNKLVGSFEKPFASSLITNLQTSVSSHKTAADEMLRTQEMLQKELDRYKNDPNNKNAPFEAAGGSLVVVEGGFLPAAQKEITARQAALQLLREEYNIVVERGEAAESFAKQLILAQVKLDELATNKIAAEKTYNEKLTVGLTLANRRADIVAKNALLDVANTGSLEKQVVIQAEINAINLRNTNNKEKMSKEDSAALEMATKALIIEKDKEKIINAQTALEKYRNKIIDDGLVLEQRLVKNMNIRVANSKTLLADARKLKNIESGLTGLSGVDRSRAATQQTRDMMTRQYMDASNNQSIAKTTYDDLVARSNLAEPTATPQMVSEAQKQLDIAKNLVNVTRDQILEYEKRGEILLQNAGAETKVAQARLDNLSMNPAVTRFNEIMLDNKAKKIVLSEQEQKALYAEYEAQMFLNEALEVKSGIFSSLSDNISGAFSSIVDGTKTAKQAFGDMAIAILKDISQMIIRMMVMRAVASLFGPIIAPAPSMTMSGPGMGMSLSDFGFATGGIATPSGKIPGYAVGGVARGSSAGYPAILHGTEAVVPLPNGKSIPVEMKSGGAQNNNVVVNVSVDSQGRGQPSTESQSGADAGNLGNAIAKAVQQELQNQKRSGGILNPYGVA
jgi:hypothetical protein